MLQRVTLEISGQVQGVFLRKNIQQRCRSLGLGGYVRNTDHGSVEASIEGSVEKIRQLIKWIENHPGTSQVKKITKATKVISQQQQDFKIYGI